MTTKPRDYLRKERKKRGLSQKRMAKMLGIGRSTYCQIELGTKDPNLEVSLAISDLFEIEVRKLKYY